MKDAIKWSDAIKEMQKCFQALTRQNTRAVKMIEAVPSADRPQGGVDKNNSVELWRRDGRSIWILPKMQ